MPALAPHRWRVDAALYVGEAGDPFELSDELFLSAVPELETFSRACLVEDLEQMSNVFRALLRDRS